MKVRNKVKPDVWLVLGCHRSGTSLFSSILSELGGVLPSNLLRPSLSNINGFNESWYWVEANDKILRKIGLEWDSIIPTPKSIESISFIDCQKKHVIEAITKALNGKPISELPLIIKDPRICRTFPIWEKAFLEMGLKFNIFMPVRHPFEVVQSLVVRDNLEPTRACYIWIWNLVEALIFSKGKTPRFIIYDKILMDSKNYLSEIFGKELPKSVHEKINIKLNHNRTARSLYSRDAEPFRTAIDLYEEILESKIPQNELIIFCEKIRFHSQFSCESVERINTKIIRGYKKNLLLHKKDFICENQNIFNSSIRSTPTHLSIRERVLLILKNFYERYKNC